MFEDAGWRPLFRFQDPLAHAAGKLKDGHSELAEKYKTHRQQKSFLVEQRFSAFLLQGVIASMQANELAGTDRSRRNHEALRHFEAALSVESKKSDPLALELKGLQLIKMDRIDEAHQVLESVEASAAAMLGGAAELEDVQRVQLEVQRIRIARYRAELHHRAGSHHTANIIMNPIASSVGRRELAGQDLLERAQFHELHACIRVSFAKTLNAQNPAEGVAAASIRAAKNDYQSINEALDDREFSWPSRLWRALFNLDKRDGTARLRAEAEAGLSRVQMIAGLSGCSVCGVRLQPRDNSNTTAKPIATDTRN